MFDFGDNLKTLRKNKKMSQKVLATKVNVSESMICRYEKGEIYPPFEVLRSLSGILNVSLDELCGTQSKGTNSLYGLTDEQAILIQNLTVAFRNHNITTKKAITTEQCLLLGQIVVEFSK